MNKTKNELKDVKSELVQIKNLLQYHGIGYDNQKNSDNLPDKMNQTNGIVLNQNAPNPFAEHTTISYFIPDNVNNAQLFIYDLSGKIISKINITDKGNGNIDVYASDLSTGIYSYSIVADENVLEPKKMIRTK